MRMASSESSVTHHSAQPPASSSAARRIRHIVPHRDSGAPLVEAGHSGLKEALILPVTHTQVRALFPPPIIVGCLDKPHIRVVKVAYQGREKIRLCLVVGIDDAYYLRVGGGLPEGEVERPSFGAGAPVEVKEAKALTQAPTVRFDGSPEV